jgi:hypothetical protein
MNLRREDSVCVRCGCVVVLDGPVWVHLDADGHLDRQCAGYRYEGDYEMVATVHG